MIVDSCCMCVFLMQSANWSSKKLQKGLWFGAAGFERCLNVSLNAAELCSTPKCAIMGAVSQHLEVAQDERRLHNF